MDEVNIWVYSTAVGTAPDGNVHTVPTNGPEHIESKDCWCHPELIEDFTATGGAKLYLHKEIQ